MRSSIAELPASRIREVANAGIGLPDVLAFWFGEGDEVTPALIRQAAIDALQEGDTFYSHNFGITPLREAIAAYTRDLHPSAGVQADRVVVTSAGVSALMVANQALVDAGDEVVAVVPVWPNLVAQPAIMGARVRTVALQPDAGGAWRLDVQALLDAITPATRMLVVNAPNNPTGWTLSPGEQAAILAHCRRTGTWILADEVYERLYYVDGVRCAPSFLDHAQGDDRLVVVHSFSKSFLMTGWRLGWMVAPVALTELMGKLIEFNTSCAPVFIQRAGLAALEAADQIVPAVQSRMRACRDTLVQALSQVTQVRMAQPDGGMYVWFQLAGQGDSLAVAKRLVREARLGLAPGVAFAPEAEGWLRWCFASRDHERLREGVRRLQAWIAEQPVAAGALASG